MGKIGLQMQDRNSGLFVRLAFGSSFVLGLATNACSQDSLHFSVDRPGISDYPTIVPKGNLQIESGMEYYQREGHRSIFLPTVMLRTAVSKRVEVRVTNRLLRVDSTADQSDHDYYYFGAVDVKALLTKEHRLRPAISLLVGYSVTPETTKKLSGPMWGDYALLLMENTLSDRLLLNYNVGVFWDGKDSRLSEMYSFCIEWELGHSASVFLEQSTLFNHYEKNDYWIDGGYTHLIGRHSQMDFSAGTNLNGGEHDFFFAVGYSTRIAYKKG